MRCPVATSRSSPARWPIVSFTCLNRSRSMNSIASWWPDRHARERAWSTRSFSCTRFAEAGQRIVQPARGFELDEPRGPGRRPRQHLAEYRGRGQRDHCALERGLAVTTLDEHPAQHGCAERRDQRRRAPALRQAAPRDDDDEEHGIDTQGRLDAREVMQLVGARRSARPRRRSRASRASARAAATAASTSRRRAAA